MNTTEKGNELEDQVFNYLKKLIKSGALGIVEKNSKIYKQKSYNSLERGAIVFDISIEVFFEGTDTPSFIFLIECKNYKKNVPVDDVQSFADNVFQVARHNAKAICITNKGFQSGAIKTAKARKIGLWKITEDDHEIILNRRFNRKLDKPSEIELCLTDETYLPSSYGSNFIQTPYRLTSCLIELFNDLMIDHPELLKKYQSTFKRTKVKYLSKSQISDIGEIFCSKFSVNGIVNLVEIAKSESLEIIYTDSILQENIIAEINFKTQNIMIFGDQQFSNQQIRFALAHEIAHKILKHDKYFTSESQLTDKNSVGHTNI